MKKIIAYSLLTVLLSFFCAQPGYALKTERLSANFVSDSGAVSRAGREVASGRIFVKFQTSVSSPSVLGALVLSGYKLIAGDYPGGWNLFELPADMSVSFALQALKARPGLAAVEPSGVYRAQRMPNDQYFALQYALKKTDALRAWDFEIGLSSRVTVAVIDTGIDSTHPDLASKFAGVSQFFDPNAGGAMSANSPPTAACYHGTGVAGIAAAESDNSLGITGISWGAKLISLKIFSDADCLPDCSDQNGYGSCVTDDATIANAITYAAGLHNQTATGKVVVNMSIGNSAAGNCGGMLQASVSNAVSKGLVIVAAAGNYPQLGVTSPANCVGVIPVGATDASDNIASFSAYDSVVMPNRGVSAPGVRVYTTALNNSYAYEDGTSFSSPFVAGLAALIWSAKPSLTATQIADGIRNSADDAGLPGPDASYGWGRVNVYKTMLFAVNGSTAAYALAQVKPAYAYPSPYNPASGRPLSFAIPESIMGADLAIEIFTIEGEKVAKLTTAVWSGKNDAGYSVASGIYLFTVKTDRGKAKGKFAVLRK